MESRAARAAGDSSGGSSAPLLPRPAPTTTTTPAPAPAPVPSPPPPPPTAPAPPAPASGSNNNNNNNNNNNSGSSSKHSSPLPEAEREAMRVAWESWAGMAAGLVACVGQYRGDGDETNAGKAGHIILSVALTIGYLLVAVALFCRADLACERPELRPEDIR
ncbi:hypothetical protein CCUS01_01361 [Colletotrichum cuscutae]|uniref:Uncharacterized protein n=1 Tax=Colletotrichum cuscutae TaxID=1209917 RepID=A0AAI9UNH7_9PEZI|nr:hypothetical protein CCUS01_01361 [Colletotrichum cuscutae]